MSEVKESGLFRKRRNKFSQVSNHCLDNDNLSLRAKGLYALIQSKIDIPGYVLYKTILQDKFCKEGRDAFNAAWKELVNAGYLKIYKINTRKGFIYEYELLDEPESEQSENENSNKSSALKTRLSTINSPGTENPHVGYPGVEKPTTNNTYSNNTNTNNTNIIVDDNKVNSNSLSDQLKQKENEIKSLNENYDIFNDEQFISLEDDNSQVLMNEFNEKHKKFKAKSLYKFSDIALNWLRYSEAYGNSDIVVVKAEKTLSKVLNSFKNKKERLSICELDAVTLNDLFEMCIKYYDSNAQSNIQDINAYIATIVREKLV